MMTEVRDPYPFPKLEGDDKFGPTAVRASSVILKIHVHSRSRPHLKKL